MTFADVFRTFGAKAAIEVRPGPTTTLGEDVFNFFKGLFKQKSEVLPKSGVNENIPNPSSTVPKTISSIGTKVAVTGASIAATAGFLTLPFQKGGESAVGLLFPPGSGGIPETADNLTDFLKENGGTILIGGGIILASIFLLKGK